MVWNHSLHQTAAAAAVSVDGVSLFLQGTILGLALLAVLLVAERGSGLSDLESFAAQGASIPGSGQERAAETAGLHATEVYPLMLFSVGGMLLFPAANDLLTMFVALEVLSLPLYLLCGLARRRRLLSQEAAMKYFLLGAFSSAFFLYGIALLYGYSGSVRLTSDRPGDLAGAALGRAGARRRRAAGGRPAVQGRRRAVPRVDPGRLPGRPDADHRLHGRGHQGGGVRRPAAHRLRRAAGPALGLAAGDCGAWRS